VIPTRAEPGRRRARYLLWAGAAVALAAVVYGALVVAVRFEGPAEVRFAPDAEAVTLPDFEGGTHSLRYRHGGTVSFSFPLHNDGVVPITVTAVRLDDEARSMLLLEEVVVGTDRLPARLGAGATTEVRVTARYGNCRYYHEREAETLAGVHVRASALGIGVTREVAFDHPLVVRSPMIVDCPDRTLVRDDDVRR
jgi:hypothetical protein